jgi:hypothetical protein
MTRQDRPPPRPTQKTDLQHLITQVFVGKISHEQGHDGHLSREKNPFGSPQWGLKPSPQTVLLTCIFA